MDAREQLRRFLEQRKEAGETDLVFDSLSVDEAMAILGARRSRAHRSRGRDRFAPRAAWSTRQSVPH
jgi:DNA polymerase